MSTLIPGISRRNLSRWFIVVISSIPASPVLDLTIRIIIYSISWYFSGIDMPLID